MNKQEFEKYFGESVNDKEFEQAQMIYMECRESHKETWVKDYKKCLKSDCFNDVVNNIYQLRETIRQYSETIGMMQKRINAMRTDIEGSNVYQAHVLIDIANSKKEEDIKAFLENRAISITSPQEYLAYKVEMGYELSEEDRLLLSTMLRNSENNDGIV